MLRRSVPRLGQFIPNLTFKTSSNQIVYQGAGYKCKRVNRHSVILTVMGEDARQKITLKLRNRQIIKGQIRLIRNEQGVLEVHWARTRAIILPTQSFVTCKNWP